MRDVSDDKELQVLGECLEKVSNELARLTEMALHIEFAIATVTVDLDQSKISFVRDLQKADQLTQELEGLSAFLSKIAQMIPTSWQFEASPAFSAVKMHSQTHRLRTGIAPVEQSADDCVEIFTDKIAS